MDETKIPTVEELLAKAKKSASEVGAEKRAGAYPELKHGQLLFQCGEYPEPKEYITLTMNEDNELIKKILGQKGGIDGHAEIPCDHIEWDLPNMEEICKAVKKEFYGEELIERNSILALFKKYLGHEEVGADCKHNLVIKGSKTKFNLLTVREAVASVAKLITQRDAERLICKEIAKKIKNVL